MAFVREHKGALAVSATLAAFLADPRPFLDSAKSLSGAVAQPLAEVPGRVALAAARSIDWWIGWLCGAVLLVFVAFRRLRRVPSP